MKKVLLFTVLMFAVVGFTMAQQKPRPHKPHRAHHKMHHHHPHHRPHPKPHH